eukprot:jgi/Bigna1/76465/fgenesh1_pg.41_\
MRIECRILRTYRKAQAVGSMARPGAMGILLLSVHQLLLIQSTGLWKKNKRGSHFLNENDRGRRVMLHRALSKLGICSRSVAAKVILRRQVEVNGATAVDPYQWVDIKQDEILVVGGGLKAGSRSDGGDGKPEIFRRVPDIKVWACYKPVRVLCSRIDNKGRNRRTIYDVMAKADNRSSAIWKFPIGRLDYMSEGLILLTNDGKLGDRLSNPLCGLNISKTYIVDVAGRRRPSKSALRKLSKGVVLEGRLTRPANFTLIDSWPQAEEEEEEEEEEEDRGTRKLIR